MKKINDFFIELKSIRFAEITPEKITGARDYNENFFKQLDIIENNILDGQSFEETVQSQNLEIVRFNKINSKKEDLDKNKINDLSDNLFKKIYNLNSIQSPEIINVDSKYYLAEIIEIEKKNKAINDPEVQEALLAQLNFKNKIETNSSIIRDLSMDVLNSRNLPKFVQENNLELKNYKISNLKQNDIFSEGVIKRIFLTKDGEIDLVTNNTLTKSFLILAVKTDYKELKK